jgi:hypothetical protein
LMNANKHYTAKARGECTRKVYYSLQPCVQCEGYCIRLKIVFLTICFFKAILIDDNGKERKKL